MGDVLRSVAGIINPADSKCGPHRAPTELIGTLSLDGHVYSLDGENNLMIDSTFIPSPAEAFCAHSNPHAY